MRKLLLMCSLFALPVDASEEIVRHPMSGARDFPVAQAVAVPAGFELIFHSGIAAAPADPDAPKASPAYWGDTYTQTLSALSRLEASLGKLGLTLGDVVKMTVFLVGDPAKGGTMDFDGFMRAYRRFFGTPEQPRLPARSTVQVASIAVPGLLVEIEATAARTSGK